MNRHPLLHTSNAWLDLSDASKYAGVDYDELVDAITARQVRASTTQPERPGDWMVPVSDVDQWAGRCVLSPAAT